LGEGVAKRAAELEAITSALNSDAAKRVIDSDPLLKQQIEAADAEFQAAQKQAADTDSQLADVHSLALQEFARLLAPA
jgi:hypothetical protein